MATLVLGDETLRVEMNRWERIFALHGEISVPADHVVDVVRVDDPWPHLRGFRAPGTGCPWVIMLGTLRYQGTKDFCAVYRRGPATIVTLRDSAFARIIVSDHPPQSNSRH